MGVGLRLKNVLRDRKMTIKQLAKDADIPVNTLYSITKRDSERVDPVILQRIANTLHVPVSELTGRPDTDASVDFERHGELLKIPPELARILANAPPVWELPGTDDYRFFFYRIPRDQNDSENTQEDQE